MQPLFFVCFSIDGLILLLDPDILVVFIFIFWVHFPAECICWHFFWVCQSMGSTGFGEGLNLNLCTQIGLATWVSFWNSQTRGSQPITQHFLLSGDVCWKCCCQDPMHIFTPITLAFASVQCHWLFLLKGLSRRIWAGFTATRPHCGNCSLVKPGPKFKSCLACMVFKLSFPTHFPGLNLMLDTLCC